MSPSAACRFQWSRRIAPLAITALAIVLASAVPASADFIDDLTRLDAALQANAARVGAPAVLSCQARRHSAVRLYEAGEITRAERSLKFCWTILGISETEAMAVPAEPPGPTAEELEARANREFQAAMVLTPNPTNGLKAFRECTGCHTTEGWGLKGGTVPQIAGQHRTVLIKQLADIRAGNRDAFVMVPYASVDSIGGPQAVADVAAYIESLEISVDNSKGPGRDLERGQQLYAENCVRCHGSNGEGDAAAHVPRIHAQHFNYLVRQFQWIRDGKRRNANAEMIDQIQRFGDEDVSAVLDYVSRLVPPEALQAPPGWKNPDFAQ